MRTQRVRNFRSKGCHIVVSQQGERCQACTHAGCIRTGDGITMRACMSASPGSQGRTYLTQGGGLGKRTVIWQCIVSDLAVFLFGDNR